MREIKGNLKSLQGVVNLQPTAKQWKDIREEKIKKEDLSAIDMIESVVIRERDVSKLNYQIVTYDENDNKEYSSNLQALGNEATAIFKASQNKEVVKVILNEKDYVSESGKEYKSYTTMAIQNITQNKENLLDMSKSQDIDKSNDIDDMNLPF